MGPLDEPNFFFGMLLRDKFARHSSRILIGSPHPPLVSQRACAGRRWCGDPTMALGLRLTSVRRAIRDVAKAAKAATSPLTPRARPHSFHAVARRHGDGERASLPPRPAARQRMRAACSPPRPLRCAAAEHVERLNFRRRPVRVDALVCQRREVEREARASRPATRRNSDGDRVVRRIHLERKNVQCNCLTRLPLFADRRKSSVVPCPSRNLVSRLTWYASAASNAGFLAPRSRASCLTSLSLCSAVAQAVVVKKKSLNKLATHRPHTRRARRAPVARPASRGPPSCAARNRRSNGNSRSRSCTLVVLCRVST